MRNIWFISDTHFGHTKIIPWAKRPFETVEEMDQCLADNWADRIGEPDLVYHLGDVTWTDHGLRLFDKLPGTKRLILGNHDDAKKLASMVQKIELFRRFREQGFICSHMPMFPEKGREPVNVHGHVHATDIDHPAYLNISVEKTDYRPLHLDELTEKVAERVKILAELEE